MCSNLSAQTKDPAMSGPKLGIGVDAAFLTGSSNEFYKPGFGGSIQFQTPIAKQLNFTASAGYLHFKGKDFYFNGIGRASFGSFGVIPVKAGIKYFLLENLYAGAEIGAAFATGSGSGTSFLYTPNIGVEFPVSDHGSIDFGARYESWSNDGTARFFGLRLAYNFGF